MILLLFLLGNKDDIIDRKVKPSQVNYQRMHNVHYYDISTIRNYNIEKPLYSLNEIIINKTNKLKNKRRRSSH